MNCPSRTDEPEGTGMNQSPPSLAAALTTRADLNGMANSRVLRRSDEREPERLEEAIEGDSPDGNGMIKEGMVVGGDGPPGGRREKGRVARKLVDARDGLKKFLRFLGPGMMVCLLVPLCLVSEKGSFKK